MSEVEPAEESPRPASAGSGGQKDESDEAEVPGPVLRPSPAPVTPTPTRADVPAFALAFPSDPALDEIVAAFERGDYARVHREAPALARRTSRPEVRRAARELARRLEPDPIAVYLLLAASLLLAVLSLWYWTHPHEAP